MWLIEIRSGPSTPYSLVVAGVAMDGGLRRISLRSSCRHSSEHQLRLSDVFVWVENSVERERDIQNDESNIAFV